MKIPYHMKKQITHLLLASAILVALFPISAFAEEAAAPPPQMSIIQTILHGGPMIVFIWLCIVGVSITMVTFMIQLIMQLRNEVLAPKALIQSLRAAIDAGNYQEAWEICKANKAYMARVLGGVLERVGKGKELTEMALIEHGQREASVYKTKNSYLSVIGVIAPMIGLLGTVIGMMGAFAVLGSSGVSDPRKLALSIGEVLMATASGLFLAIPAFISYYYFRNVITASLAYADNAMTSLIEDIPFAELEGIRIGEHFKPGVGGLSEENRGSQKVSMELTTSCPMCGGVIQAGQTPCPHCGGTLDWN